MRKRSFIWEPEHLESRRMLSAPPLPTIPSRVFNITSYGATATSSNNTAAIQNAISVASSAGGGIVEIPAASQDWECGPITLANSIDLQIDSGATLQMLPYGTYPVMTNGDYADFITCTNLSNVEVSGSGGIDGQGSAWWTAYDANSSQARPYGMISFAGCTKVEVIGITLTNPPNTHIDFSNECNDVTVNGITINTPVSPNTDGIDMSAENALIENSSIADGDDNIAIGGTSGQASSNVTITNDTFGIGHGCSIGSYTEAGINGLTVSNCSFNGTTAGIRLKSERGRGGLVENLIYTNITMTNVEYPININSYYNDGSVPSTPTDPAQAVTSTTPIWQNITISNLTSTTTSGESNYNGSYCGIIWGLPEEPVNGVTLSNVQLSARYGMDINHVRGVTFDSTSKITALGGGGTEISTYNGASPDTPYDAVVLAANYTDQDLGSPATTGNPLFNPDTGLWSTIAGGTGIGGSSDQFNFVATTLSGNATYFAKLTSLSSSSSAAGVMFRDSTDTATSAFAAVLDTPSSGVEFEWRASNGATAATPITVASIVTPIWIELVRSGSSFTAFYGSNGTTWTQIGTSSETVTMSTSALAGMAVSANSSSATTTAGFSNPAGPSITVAPAASPQPATGTTANLSVTASETGSTLTYTWSIISSPSGATNPTFSVNGTSAAKSTTATFSSFGVYVFLVTITDSNNVSTTAVLGVGVNQTAVTISISPTSVTIGAIGTQIFTASATDQFGVIFEPVFAWSLASGIGTENSSFGFYTAPAATGSAMVKAAVGSASGTATVTIVGPVVSSAAAASPNPVVTGTTTFLTAAGTQNGSSSGLTYTWSATGPKAISSYFANGSATANSTTATFAMAGSYQFTVTIQDTAGLTTTSVVNVTVDQKFTSVAISPTSSSLNENGTQAFTATAFDQFSQLMSPQPTFSWSLASGVGSINASSGVYTAPNGTGSAAVQATASSITSPSSTITITNAAPTVMTAAAASPSPVTGTTTALSVLGADDGGESNLTYTWTATTVPMGATAPNFSVNGTNAAKNSTATFSQAGTYAFTVTIEDSGGLTVTSTSPNVIVNQTAMTITVTPPSSSVGSTASLQFSASAVDQFGNAIVSPTFTWSATGSSNSINSAGLFDAGSTSGPFSVQAAIGSVNGTAAVSIVPIVYSNPGTYYVALAADQSTEQIWVGSSDVGSPTWSVPITLLPSLTFNGGPDNLTVDFTNGDSVPQGGLTFNGGSGANSLSIIGTSGNDTVNVGSAAVTFDSDTPIGYSNLQSITVNGGTGADVLTQSGQPGGSAALSFQTTSTDTLNIEAGLYGIPAPAANSGFNVYPLSQLSIANGASMALQTATAGSDRTVMVLNSLAVGSTGQLDLGGNDMIDQSDGLSAVNNLIASGFNAGGSFWAGDGITSSLAVTTPGMALGIELNDTKPDGTGTAIVSSFDGVPVGIADVLVKYTRFGDADLDGSVTAADYLAIDNGFNSGGTLSGWQNGDLNYDGQINGDDYTLIDNSYNSQVASPEAEVANSPTVPAPADPQGQIAPVHVSVAVFSSVNEISQDELSHRHISRLADWLSSSSQSYVPPG
jgi:polygalacturonase